MDNIVLGAMDAFSIPAITAVIFGILLGYIVGVVPGLSRPAALAVAVPLTYYMSPIAAIAFLIGVTKASAAGGATGAIMLNTPGEPSSAATCYDGYPLARAGYAPKALKIALYASVFGDIVATLTASRVTQKKVRKLTVTARECLVEVDYLEQSVLIHRDSYPEYLTDDGKRRYRHESVVERPRIATSEPLRCELESFVEAVRTGSEPEVTAEDGIAALETVQAIDSRLGNRRREPEVNAR